MAQAEPLLDVEFPQLLQDMIGDLTSAPQPVVIKLFAEDGELLRHWAPGRGERDQENPRRVDVEDGIENRLAALRLRSTIDPVTAARAGFTPQEVELDASAMLQGEPATPPVVFERAILHDSSTVPTLCAQNAREHAEDSDRQRNRKDCLYRIACQPDGDSGPDRNHSRKPAALRERDGTF